MPRLAKELTAIEVSRLVKPTPRPGFHFVGVVRGLALLVASTGAASWVLRATVGGKRRDIGLGPYPEVSLASARDKARAARDQILAGVDPIEERARLRSEILAAQATAVTFRDAADRYMIFREGGWTNAKHAAQWRSTLEAYAYPVLEKLLVRDIGIPQVLQVLEPIWAEKNETADRLRSRIKIVLDWATSNGYRSGPNPAAWKGCLDTRLKARREVATVEHHPALPINEMGEFMRQLRQQAGTGARALEFAILTAARSGEVRGATWSEIDLAAATWTVPAERMKAGKEHRVPLSTAALALLESIPRQGETDLVFPGRSNTPVSDMTLTAVMRRMGVDAVPHGFRSTFRVWASELTSYPHDAQEMALAHAIPNKVEAAYRRGDLFEKRRLMMEDWAKFCARPVTSAGITPMATKRKTAA